MNRMLGCVVIPLVLLAGCASAPSATNGAQAQAATGSYYCWKNKLETGGDKLVCNWARSAADACRSIEVVTVNKSAVSSGPKEAGRCTNGEWLVQVTTK